jgi:hypothetical protein
MKSLYFIAAVAILSQVRPSAGFLGLDGIPVVGGLLDTAGSLAGGLTGGLTGGGGDASLSKEVARSSAYFVIGFINSNSRYCVNLASIESCQKKTTGLNLLGIVQLLPGATYIEENFYINAWVNDNWLKFNCNAVLSSKDAAYTLIQYKCPQLGIAFPGGSGGYGK